MKWLFLFLSFSIFAQSNYTEQVLEQFLEQRKKMMQEFRKAFDDDMQVDDFFDDDDFMQEFKKGNINNLRGFRGSGQDFTIEEKSYADGKIGIFIKPKDKNISLDIKTENDRITIKSEKKIKEESEGKFGTSSTFSTSTSSRSIGIPFGYKAQDPVAEGDAIKIKLVPQKKLDTGRVPIGKQKGDKTL